MSRMIKYFSEIIKYPLVQQQRVGKHVYAVDNKFMHWTTRFRVR